LGVEVVTDVPAGPRAGENARIDTVDEAWRAIEVVYPIQASQ